MRKMKKAAALLLAAVMALSVAMNVRAVVVVDELTGEVIERNVGEHDSDTMPPDGAVQLEIDFASLPSFSSITGEVLEVHESEYFTRIRLERGISVLDFNLNQNTYLHGGFPQVGDTVTGFYDTWLPVIMIYPPQLTAVVLVNHENEDDDMLSVFVDRFYAVETTHGETELLSADGSHRLNITAPDTVIVSQGGQDASDWELDGRKLAVFFSAMSRSLPPLIFAPEKIVVMYETAVHPGPAPIDWDDDENGGYMGIVPPIGDISDMDLDVDGDFVFYDIVINGIGLPGANFLSADGVFPTHVPIRAIAESLGIAVEWRRPYVHLRGEWGDLAFRNNSREVTKNGEVITMSTPNIVISGTMFMPLEFFRTVAGFNNAYSIGGTVFINNFERVE